MSRATLRLVAAGFGVSLAPKSITGIGASTGVVFVDVVDSTPIVEFNIVWRRADPSPILQTFLATVLEIAHTL
ncbi:MAG: hypothetical protein NVSMB44_44010 [Ktedonobacteraceae bacterium]